MKSDRKISLPLKFPAQIWILTLVILLGAIPPSAAEVVILKSQDLGPYNETVSSILASQENPAQVQVFSLGGDPAKINEVASEIGAPPSLFIAIGTQSASAIRSAFPQSPMIFAMLPRSRGQSYLDKKTTGIYLDLTFETQLKLILKLLPKTQRLGIILGEDNRMVEKMDIIRKGQESGITVIVSRTPDISSFSEVLSAMISQIDLFLILPDSLWGQKETVLYLREKLVDKNIPFVAFSQALVRMGAVMSFSPDYTRLGKQLGEDINDFAAKGTLKTPADPPFRITINKTLMDQYGISIPPSLQEKVDYQ